MLGTYYVTREAVPGMERGGRIVVTASIWGKTGVAAFGAYCASKHANIGFMRALAQELAGLMEPDDVAAAYLFLASDAAADITGQTLNVDRGKQMS